MAEILRAAHLITGISPNRNRSGREWTRWKLLVTIVLPCLGLGSYSAGMKCWPSHRARLSFQRERCPVSTLPSAGSRDADQQLSLFFCLNFCLLVFSWFIGVLISGVKEKWIKVIHVYISKIHTPVFPAALVTMARTSWNTWSVHQQMNGYRRRTVHTHGGTLLSRDDDGIICSAEGTGDCPTEWRWVREGQISHETTYMWNLKKWYK